MRKKRTLEQVKEKYDRLVTNLPMIKNKQGNTNVRIMISALKMFIENPNLNLKGEIDNSFGTKKQMLRWIAGETV